MSFNVNKVILVGNLTRDPELRYTSTGLGVANFSLATNRSVKKDEGYVDVPSFHRVVVWGKLGEFAGKNLFKGDKVYIEGRLETKSYTSKDGQPKSSTEVIAEQVIPFQRTGAVRPTPGTTTTPVAPKTEQQKLDEDFPDREPANENVDPEEVEKGLAKEKEKKEQDNAPEEENMFP